MAELPSLLTDRIADPVAYVATVRGKKLKSNFKKFAAEMAEGDELWEWEWFGTPSASAKLFVRLVLGAGEAVDSFCHSAG